MNWKKILSKKRVSYIGYNGEAIAIMEQVDERLVKDGQNYRCIYVAPNNSSHWTKNNLYSLYKEPDDVVASIRPIITEDLKCLN